MGKKSLNKQAELRRKMELAKQQKKQRESGDDSTMPASLDDATQQQLSSQEIKDRNDRRRFEELLKRSSSTVLNDFSSDGYLNKQQEEEDITAQRSGVDRLFEGDPAPTACFQELHNVQTESTIGKAGMERLVPWMRGKGQLFDDEFDDAKEYLICLSDPRSKSTELRQAAKTLLAELPPHVLKRLVIVNADSPAENRRWLKRNDNLRGKIEVLCDEKLEWMRAYTALGDKRWSMTVFVLANRRVQKLAREVDVYAVSRTIQKAVQSFLSETRYQG